MNDSQMEGAEDVAAIMQCMLSEHLTPSAFAEDHKLLIRTKSIFKQAVRDEKKIRTAFEQEKKALEMEIIHSKAKISEQKADCERLRTELSLIEEGNAKLKADGAHRTAYIQELKRDLVVRKLERLRILKLNAERSLEVAMKESRRLEMKIEARSAGSFIVSDTQILVFDNGNPRIQTIASH